MTVDGRSCAFQTDRAAASSGSTSLPLSAQDRDRRLMTPAYRCGRNCDLNGYGKEYGIIATRRLVSWHLKRFLRRFSFMSDNFGYRRQVSFDLDSLCDGCMSATRYGMDEGCFETATAGRQAVHTCMRSHMRAACLDLASTFDLLRSTLMPCY